MEAVCTITVEVPAGLLEKAQRASGAGITQTVVAALQILAASDAYAKLLAEKGKIRFAKSAAQLKADR
jgi:hypothetical protein